MTEVLVLTTAPSEDAAATLADEILQVRLAACIQISSPITSVYRWKGEIFHEPEWQLWIKTTQECAHQLVTFITDHHPFELPEVITIPIIGGLPAYLDWIQTETASTR